MGRGRTGPQHGEPDEEHEAPEGELERVLALPSTTQRGECQHGAGCYLWTRSLELTLTKADALAPKEADTERSGRPRRAWSFYDNYRAASGGQCCGHPHPGGVQLR